MSWVLKDKRQQKSWRKDALAKGTARVAEAQSHKPLHSRVWGHFPKSHGKQKKRTSGQKNKVSI